MPELEYYPHRRYVEKNLKGESEIQPADFTALAFAQKRAVEQGVLSKDVAKYMIPMAMVEGWSNNYGVRGDLALYASKENIERFRKMGLVVRDAEEEKFESKQIRGVQAAPPRDLSLMERVKWAVHKPGALLMDKLEKSTRDERTPKELTDAWDSYIGEVKADAHPDKIQSALNKYDALLNKGQPDKWAFMRDEQGRMPAAQEHRSPDLVVTNLPGKGKDRFIVLNNQRGDENISAAIMAGILGEKASHRDVKTPEDAVKRYNGRGKGVEWLDYDDSGPVPADVDVYLSKVQEAHRMIDHEANAPLRGLLEEVGAIR